MSLFRIDCQRNASKISVQGITELFRDALVYRHFFYEKLVLTAFKLPSLIAPDERILVTSGQFVNTAATQLYYLPGDTNGMYGADLMDQCGPVEIRPELLPLDSGW